MSKELVALAKPKSRAIAGILTEGDTVIVEAGPFGMKVMKIHKDGRMAVNLLGDFTIKRKIRSK